VGCWLQYLWKCPRGPSLWSQGYALRCPPVHHRWCTCRLRGTQPPESRRSEEPTRSLPREEACKRARWCCMRCSMGLGFLTKKKICLMKKVWHGSYFVRDVMTVFVDIIKADYFVRQVNSSWTAAGAPSTEWWWYLFHNHTGDASLSCAARAAPEISRWVASGRVRRPTSMLFMVA